MNAHIPTPLAVAMYKLRKAVRSGFAQKIYPNEARRLLASISLLQRWAVVIVVLNFIGGAVFQMAWVAWHHR